MIRDGGQLDVARIMPVLILIARVLQSSADFDPQGKERKGKLQPVSIRRQREISSPVGSGRADQERTRGEDDAVWEKRMVL